jgi:hypothetical protein
MAIKGKGKQRRRTVTGGPKPQYVPPKKPLWRRRGFQVGLGVFLLAALAAGITAILLVKSSNDEKEVDAKAVAAFSAEAERALVPVGQRLPGTLEIQPFPSLATSLSGLRSGSVSESQAAAEGRADASNASATAKAIDGIDVTALVSGHPELLDMLDSQTLLSQSLQLYAQAGSALTAASRASGKPRDALIAQGEGAVEHANRLFSSGYDKLTTLRLDFGVPQPPPGRLAPPSAPPSPTSPPPPTPSPSPKTTATPVTPSPSATSPPSPSPSPTKK